MKRHGGWVGNNGPLVISDRGRPAHVLMLFEGYQQLTRQRRNAAPGCVAILQQRCIFPLLTLAQRISNTRQISYKHTIRMHLIRPLHPNDSLLEITNLLHRAYARLGAMGLNYTAVDQSPDVTAQRIAGGQCYVVEVGAKLAGTIVVKPTYRENDCEYFTRAGVAAVHQFAVDPEIQGKGIGRALLQASENWARDQGFRELAMDTAEQAAHLIKLYTALGYAHVGFVQWPGKVYRSLVLSKALQ